MANRIQVDAGGPAHTARAKAAAMTKQALDALEGLDQESRVVLLGVQRVHLDTASAKSASSITSSRGANSGV
ncbi:hypothetical protein ACH4U5_26900 [Streptomyces sp. NPDC020858]|uniref:hypothetical protein n=1 Tax=Streptomyces sp. NPDC020858 TaxID=3365097 RepID=UPI00378BDDDD